MERLPENGGQRNPNPDICSFFLPLKRRFCKMRVKEGAVYCGEHSILDGGSNRVPCPYDPNHTVEGDKLERHLEKCNSRPRPRARFHCEGVNETEQRASVLLPTTPDMSSWMQILEFMRENSSSPRDYLYSKSYDLSTGKSGRHDLQNVLISEVIRGSMGSVRDTWIVELGAGKGNHLTFPNSSAHVCPKRKQDCLLRSLGVSHQRVFLDLKDLDLHMLLPEDLKRVVLAGKHLCGGATCLSLRAVARLKEKRPTLRILVAIATCCHQLCTFRAFPQSDGCCVSERDFDKIRKASSWYVCKNRVPQLLGDIDPVTFGLHCKTFIDSSRLRFLALHGFHVQYFNYVAHAVSPENRIIFALSPSEEQILQSSD